MNLHFSPWSRILNLIVHEYLLNMTICIMWNEAIDFQLDTYNEHAAEFTIINFSQHNLDESLSGDVLNFNRQREEFANNNIYFDKFVEKLTMSLYYSHCEGFIIFQEDIPIFVDAFLNASVLSIWRTESNKFLFVYMQDLMKENYFQHRFFSDQMNILIVEAENSKDLSSFNLKTNKYVGPRADRPDQLILLDRFDTLTGQFINNAHLYPDKTSDLQGRELVVAVFNYRPYVALRYDLPANVQDLGFDDDDDDAKKYVHVDGTEARILLTFCELYNCTMQIDSSEEDWGVINANMSGEGVLGLIIKQRAEVAVSAMYAWREDYIFMDMSAYLARTGITCIVPAPKRLASFFLPLQPFQSDMWAAVIGGLVIEMFFLVLTRRFEQIQNMKLEHWHESLSFGLSTTLKIFISQPTTQSVRGISIRLALITCYSLDIIITSVYGGGLASLLTVPSYEEAADSLERLRSHKLKWAASSEAWVSAVRASDDPSIVDILKNFDIFTLDELKDLAEEQDMGFTLERLPFGHFAIEGYITPEIVDRFKIMVDDIYFQFAVAFTTRLWPLLHRFNRLTYLWHSSGFDKYWEWRIATTTLNDYVQKKVEASMFTTTDDRGPVKLSMNNFIGILLVWIIGSTVATLVFIIEMLCHHRIRKSNF